ncbi:sodium:solute symporter [Singulisphaera sp. PoT]|uniref:sodium:solute symporter n=1 Tax=Singulisphaera sp. PoT TaxID=3411797 RepID=UPI003BF5DDA7
MHPVLAAFHFSPIDTVIIVLYIAGCTGLGAWMGSKSKELKGYFLGESNIPAWAVMISIVATETSTATFLSVPGIAYRGDFTYLQLPLGYLVGRFLVAFLLLPSYFRGEIFTAYEVLQNRFGGATRTTASILFLLTRVLADGLRLYLAARVLQVITGGSIELSILAVGLTTIVYTFLGGMKAVIWIDVIQFHIYIIGALISLSILVGKLPGGWPELWSVASAAHKFRMFNFAFDPSNAFTFWAGLFGGMVLNTATHGADQLMVQRYLSARSQGQAAGALIASGFVVFAQFALFLLIGAGLFVFFREFPPTDVGGKLAKDQEFAYFIVHNLRTPLLGIVVAAIFSAAMGTLSGSLNASAATTVNDIYRPLVPNAEDRHLLWVSRGLTAVWGLGQMAMALGATQLQENVVVNALAIASFTTGIVLGLFLLGIFTKVPQPAALAGLLVGLAAVSFAKFGTQLAWPWYALIGSSTVVSTGVLVDTLFLGGEPSAEPKPVLESEL